MSKQSQYSAVSATRNSRSYRIHENRRSCLKPGNSPEYWGMGKDLREVGIFELSLDGFILIQAES